MALVVKKPPPPPQVETTYGSRRVYTLHTGSNRVFAWRLPDERLKTATVVFKREEDALLMAHMIETHVLERREWPDCLVVDNTFTLFGGRINLNKDCELVEVRSWQMETLQVFCVRAYLDMVILNTLTQKRDTFQLNGNVMTLSLPIEVYADRLEELYGGQFDIDEE